MEETTLLLKSVAKSAKELRLLYLAYVPIGAKFTPHCVLGVQSVRSVFNVEVNTRNLTGGFVVNMLILTDEHRIPLKFANLPDINVSSSTLRMDLKNIMWKNASLMRK